MTNEQHSVLCTENTFVPLKDEKLDLESAEDWNVVKEEFISEMKDDNLWTKVFKTPEGKYFSIDFYQNKNGWSDRNDYVTHELIEVVPVETVVIKYIRK